MRDLALRGHVAGDDALRGGALKIQPRPLRYSSPLPLLEDKDVAAGEA